MALLEELIEEVLLRFPPADPASLVRAALVCKPWYRIVSDPRFRRRFREFHGSPPVLGLLCNIRDRGGDGYASRLVPASPACPLPASKVDGLALDARHGRVLLDMMFSACQCHLVVWDPTTYGWCELPPLIDSQYPSSFNAAVLCSATACDHIDCHGGPFVVACLSSSVEGVALYVYSSEAGSWSDPSFVPVAPLYDVDVAPPALVGNALYFLSGMSTTTVKYDLATRGTSVIYLPPECFGCATALMVTEDGGLGIARVDDAARISLWSMDASSNGDKGWTQIRVIELEGLLPVDACSISIDIVGFAPGIGLILVMTDDVVFSLYPKSGQVSKVCEEHDVCGVVPYMSFYTPELGVAFANEGTRSWCFECLKS